MSASFDRSRGKAVWGARGCLIAALLLTAFSSGCGKAVRQGTGTSFLIITALEAGNGPTATTFGTLLFSDVLNVINDVPTIFADVGRVRLRVGVKDPGSVNSPAGPTQNEYITVNRYHVRFIRADGRNTPGVDVPYPFDGAITVTVSTGETQAGFTLVRDQAKQEAPLAALAYNPISISTIAEVTFYGQDQTGHEVSVTGQIGINFANYGG